jgi:hypothetical protein
MTRYSTRRAELLSQLERVETAQVALGAFGVSNPVGIGPRVRDGNRGIWVGGGICDDVAERSGDRGDAVFVGIREFVGCRAG